MKRTTQLSLCLNSLGIAIACGLSGSGCSLLRDHLDPDKNVRDGGNLDGGAQPDSGGACDPEPLPDDRVTCAAYWESFRWNGQGCEQIGYSGCNPDPAYFQDYDSCQAAYRHCDRPPPEPCAPVTLEPVGLCEAIFDGYYWNGNRCEQGQVSGCSRPDDLYETQAACERAYQHCKPSPSPCMAYEWGPPERCDAYFDGYYWDGDSCQPGGWSGCNRPGGLYETKEECVSAYSFCLDRCYVGGCSSQLCTDAPGAVSTCEWRDEYACYREAFARCERQPDGECGWTPNDSLRQCIDQGGLQDCRTTGCPSDQGCEPCWSTYACLPPGVVC